MNFGIIAEYNPFHNGHFYHISESKKMTNSDNCIVVMSGNFVQRGEPALLDKFTRAEYALKNGADIVIELPVSFATGSADIFAFGATNLLVRSKIVDYLCFGAEDIDNTHIELMEQISDILVKEPIEFKELLKKEIATGISYPTARQNALKKYMRADISLDFMNKPNNILALEYIKALKQQNSKIKPIAIKRISNNFHQKEITSEISSATAIRTAITDYCTSNFKNLELYEKIKKAIPENICYDFFKKIRQFPKIEDYAVVLDYILRTKTASELSEILDITEGIENRILKNREEKTIYNLLEKLKTKRYTLTKLQHGLLHIILDIKKADIKQYQEKGLPYIRVLGFKKEKKYLLKELSENSEVPIITNVKQGEKILSPLDFSLLKKEIYSSDLYYMTTTKKINTDYTTPIVII